MTLIDDAGKARALAEAVGTLAATVGPSAYRRDRAGDRAGGGGGFGDPTGSAEASQRTLRRRLGRAGARTSAAVVALGDALGELNAAAATIDHDAEHRPDDTAAVTPRQVHPEQLADLRAQLARRDAEDSLDVLRRARAAAGKERARAKARSPKATPPRTRTAGRAERMAERVAAAAARIAKPNGRAA